MEHIESEKKSSKSMKGGGRWFEMMKKSHYLKRWNRRRFHVMTTEKKTKALVYSTSKRKNVRFEIQPRTEIRFPFGKEGLDRFQR